MIKSYLAIWKVLVLTTIPFLFISGQTFLSTANSDWERNDRTCDCDELRFRKDLTFYQDETIPYTGECKLKRDAGNKENIGNELTYKYLNGHIIEQTERYSTGGLCEEIYYDTTGIITKRLMYYRNGQKSWEKYFGDHTYETFYENGKIQRKGVYGLTEMDKTDRYYNLDEKRLFDSIWKENGDFDKVYRYSKSSITY
jgi:hypothetical protein